MNSVCRVLSGPQNREWFLKQLNADATFLRSLECMDYSLLVAKHRLHPMERTDKDLGRHQGGLGKLVSQNTM
jgi:hypothetical protein